MLRTVSFFLRLAVVNIQEQEAKFVLKAKISRQRVVNHCMWDSGATRSNWNSFQDQEPTTECIIINELNKT